MKLLSGAYAQVSDHLLTPSLDLHQKQKLSTDYPLQFVRIDNHWCQERSFEIPPQHLPRHSQAAIIDSRAKFSSVVEPQTMSSGEVRRVSRQDIQLVQNLIEWCLQLYMNQREVVETLLVQAKIEPGFTELVWQKLEEENREFFKAYHLRLMVKNQIMIFNKLLKQQVELMRKICPPGVTSLPVLNGSSHSSSLHQAPSCYVSEPTAAPSRPEIHNSLGCSPSVLMSNGLMSNGLQVHQNMQTPNNASTHAGRMDISTNMHSTQFSPMGTMHEIKHMDMIHGMNEIAVKAEPSFSNSSFTFDADRNVSETRPTIRDTCVSTFSNTDSNSQTLSVPPLLDADTSSFGFLGQIPRNFSLSDLTADFSQCSDILESYSRSPFLVADDFLDSPGRECHGYDKQLDTISEGKSYDDFGSD